MPDSIENIFDFATSIEALKKIERFRGQYFWKDYPQLARYESVADHSWRLALLVALFVDKLSQPFNLEKGLKMALIHDLPEIIAGDVSPLGTDGTGKNTHAWDGDRAKEKHEKEVGAAKELFGRLPAEQGKELYTLWLENEENQTFEARVIKALDKLECVLQVFEYRGGHLFPSHLEFNVSYGLKYVDVDPAIKEFGELIAEKMRTQFQEFQNV